MNSDKTRSLPDFPDGFLFGAATAAYQIEGAVSEDGRGPSIWDTFSHQAGRVRNGDTGDIACDHYHRWSEDLDILVDLGLDAYRFSLAWPRLFPKGSGALNPKGVDFYDRLIDGCLARKLKVFPTLYHWDLPQVLQDKGGWRNRDTANAFAEYALTVAEKFADRIDALSTFNEPWCSAMLGHLVGIHAPGEKDLTAMLEVVHGQHLAHGLAVQAVRSVNRDLPVGIVLNVMAVRPESNSESDRQAAHRHQVFNNALFLDPLFTGHYPSEIVDCFGDKLPQPWADDLSIIHQPLDFWGLNYYTPEVVTDASDKHTPFPSTQRCPAALPRTDIGWHIDATALSELLITLDRQYTLPPCFITENGAAFNHEPVQGVVDDHPRITYLEDHLHAVHQAIEHGVDIRGYFAWSLLDNFEWAEGYSMRFGLVHVNYDSQQRTLKNSAHWYRDFVHQVKRS